MAMSDENKILLNSPAGTPPNIESRLQFRNYDTRFIASNRNPFDGVPFHIDTLPHQYPFTSTPVLLFLFNRRPIAEKYPDVLIESTGLTWVWRESCFWWGLGVEVE
ncbi:hypothetical protein SLE2022_118720 [Rubroshorea leprosula]